MAAPKSGKTKPHDVTEKSRAEVVALKSFGNTHEDIAAYLNISIDTLLRKYREDLETAAIRANARVANKLYKKAVEDEEMAAIIFWLKTRARWREKDRDDQDKTSALIEKLVDKIAEK